VALRAAVSGPAKAFREVVSAVIRRPAPSRRKISIRN